MNGAFLVISLNKKMLRQMNNKCGKPKDWLNEEQIERMKIHFRVASQRKQRGRETAQ